MRPLRPTAAAPAAAGAAAGASSPPGSDGAGAVHDLYTTASYEGTPQGDLSRCYSPPLPSNASSDRVDLAYAANGQQYASAPNQTHFSTYPDPPTATFVDPAEGTEGTTVAVYGGGLAPGCDYTCRFGAAGTAAGSYDAAVAALRCEAPAAPPADGDGSAPTAAIAVSLNAQQYVESGFNFTWA